VSPASVLQKSVALRTALTEVAGLEPSKTANVAAALRTLKKSNEILLNPLFSADRRATTEIEFKASDMDDLIHGLAVSIEGGQWDLLRAKAMTLGITPASAQAIAEPSEFISAYFAAYFRGGKFIQLKLDFDAAVDKLVAELKKQFPKATDDQLKAMAQAMLGPKSDFTFGSVGDNGFVTRAGASYKMPEVDVTITPTAKKLIEATKVDSVALVSDLMRVFIEATMDARFHLPATTDATAVIAGNGLGVVPNDSDAAAKGNEYLSSDEFATVESWAGRVEAATNVGVGTVIRGAGWVALNNEHVAALVETMLAVGLRKVTENAAWCYLTCSRENPAIAPNLQDPCINDVMLTTDDSLTAALTCGRGTIHYKLTWN
jgi:hypothetical protein